MRSWKGYDFNVLDNLRKKGYICGSRRAKSVYITSEGKERAQKLEKVLLPKIKAAMEMMKG